MLVAKIFMGKELDDSVVKSYFTTAADGKRYNVIYYALEMILAVGFRVRGVRGTQFRQWANVHLSEYLVKGFTTTGARRRRGLRTRRTWRSCDESRTRRNGVVRMENEDERHHAPSKDSDGGEINMKCIVELFGDDRNGRKMIAWGRRIGCADAGHVFDPDRRKVATRLLVDDANPSQRSYLLELVDNPVGVKAIVPA